MGAHAFRMPGHVSQRNVRAVAGAALAQTEHAQDVLQRGVIPALSHAQRALLEADIAREAGDAALDARLRVHRCDIDVLQRNISNDAEFALRIAEHVGAFHSLTFFGRLRWLLTGKVR